MSETGCIGWILLALALVAVYLLPAMVAVGRNIKSDGGVFVVNLLLGWTFVGWVVALAWAVSGERRTNS